MKITIIHVGLDVDDTQYHGSALCSAPFPSRESHKFTSSKYCYGVQ